MPPDPDPAVEAAVARVVAYHQLGAAAAVHAAAAAAATGVTLVKVHQARRFARAYDAPALERLLALCREHHYPLQVSVANRLTGVPPDKRPGLELAMAEGRWSLSELNAGIRARVRGGVSRTGGRKPRVGATPAEILGTLGRECHTWARMTAVALAPGAGLPEGVADALTEAAAAVGRLQVAVAAAVADGHHAPGR